MKNDKIYRQAAIEAVKEASLGETEVPRLTRRILDYLERQEPAEPKPCEDAVSRSEFLRRIEPYNTSDKTDKALYNFAFNKIIGCPSVTPEQHLTCKGCVHLGDGCKLPCTSCKRNPALLDRYEAERMEKWE